MNGDRWTTALSLAVRLGDAFAGGRPPVGGVEVLLKGEGVRAVRNLSGYYVFAGVADGVHTVQVRSDFYFDEEREVRLPFGDPVNPVVNMTLNPTLVYPFPPGTTLLKGSIKDEAEQPVEGAKVRVLSDTETYTTEKGAFVFYFTGLTEDDVVVVDGKPYVKYRGSHRVSVRVSHPDYRRRRVMTQVEEGKTSLMLITVRPRRR